MTQIATEAGGDGELDVLFVHATGFCKELWRPVINRISTGRFSWLSMDLRGHGGSDKGPSPYRWALLGGDVLNVAGPARGILGIGHSCGAAALVRAEAERPGAFRHLVLIEPISFPPPYRRIEGPMSAAARKRRSVFPSREFAFERFARGPFRDWHRESLDAYVDHGFSATDDGWELKCSPEVEADYFAEGSNHNTWDLLAQINLPVTLVAGERSDTHREPFLSALASRVRKADVIVLPGLGHLGPMEDPAAYARIIEEVVHLG